MSDDRITWLDTWPYHQTRGTYLVKSDEYGTESSKLTLAKGLIKKIANEAQIIILLHSQMRGGGWVLTWWPANEPQHRVDDEIFYPEEKEHGTQLQAD